MKIFVYSLFVTTILAGVWLMVFLVGSAGDRTTKQAFDMLRSGMTQTEVERLIGNPYRRLNITRRDGRLEQACFYESLPVMNQNEIDAITLLYFREPDEGVDCWVLRKKLFVQNTQSQDLWIRLENVWKRAKSFSGFESSAPEEVNLQDTP